MASKSTADSSFSETLEELEQMALETCRKQGLAQNENEEFDGRATIIKFLKSKKKPTMGECNKLAFDMLDYYCINELQHDHDSKGQIVVKSLKQDWARKALPALARKLEGAWNAAHQEEEEEDERKSQSSSDSDKALPEKKGRKAGSLKERAKDRLLTSGKKVLVRKAARNLVDGGQQTFVALLASSDPNLADPALRDKVAAFVSSDLGRALTSGLMSIGVDFLPGVPDDLKEALRDELDAQALDSATLPIENVMKLALPMIGQAIAPLLTGGSGDTKLFGNPAPASSPQAAPPPPPSSAGQAAPMPEEPAAEPPAAASV